MDAQLGKELVQFQEEFLHTVEIPAKRVLALLDLVKERLSLQDIYVCESTVSKYHFLYQYVTSGPNQRIMHFNLLIQEGEAYSHLLHQFGPDHVGVLDSGQGSHNYALKPGNLVYGYLDGENVLGFLSFQPKEENAVWTQDEKDVLYFLGSLLRLVFFPDLLSQESRMKGALDETRMKFLFYYPKLHLVIPSVKMRAEFQLSYYYRLNYPEEYAEKFVYFGDKEEYVRAVNEALQKKETKSFVFRDDTFKQKIRQTVLVSRYDGQGNPEEVVCILEYLQENEEERETMRRFSAFNAITNRENLAELYLDFESGQATVFKAPSFWKDEEWVRKKDYAAALPLFVREVIFPEDQERIEKILSPKNLQRTLTDTGHSLTVESQAMLAGKEGWLRTEVIPGTSGGKNLLRNAILLFNDVTEDVQRRNDTLTGLLGKEKMFLLIHEKSEEILQFQGVQDWSIFYVNLIHFKLFNRYFGRGKGDQYLKMVATALTKYFPEASSARFGDDHFVLLADLSPEEAEKRLSRAEAFLREQNGNYTLPLHAGIYRLSRSDVLSPLAMCDAAKMACDTIRTRLDVHVSLYTERLAQKEILAHYLLDHVDEAIQDGSIEVYYQPVVRAKTMKIASLEALVRWNSKTYGFLSPSLFIPVLEEHSLSFKVDRFVIEKTASLLEERKKAGEELIPVSVNISRTDLAVMDFAQFLDETVEKHHLPKGLFAVEITESAPLKDPRLLQNAIASFHHSGYPVWMDDFGSGYSSLNALHDYAFDLLKFDLVFLRNFVESSKLILASCAEMAGKLGIHTLAEGVETKEQLDFLKGIGVEKIQGYYYSKPIPYPVLREKLIDRSFVAESEEEHRKMEQDGQLGKVVSNSSSE